MVYKINRINSVLIMAILLVALNAYAQISQFATTGIPAPMLSGTSVPSSLYICNATSNNVSYIQNLSNGTIQLWLCEYANSTYTWVQQINPTVASATSGTITGGTFVLGGCTAITTVTINGAVVGTNAAVATPIYATAPTGNQGLFNLTAWVSAANTISVQGCAIGALSSVPNFTAKVLMY